MTQTSHFANICAVHHTEITHFAISLPSYTRRDQPY
jgi:hypothetical protein